MRIFLSSPSPVQQWRGFGDFTSPGGLGISSAPLMNLFVARHTERHEIALVMRAAIAERLDVMHERRRHKASVRSAHLAQRFSCQMPVANPAPHTAVSLVLSVAASKAFVVPLHRFLVLIAVAALLVCQIRAACHAARAFRFPRHLAPLFGHEKTSAGIAPVGGRVRSYSSTLNFITSMG